ncbi:hypothetical protein R84B8_01295 [Treponema sp. R8-4-B8]
MVKDITVSRSFGKIRKRELRDEYRAGRLLYEQGKREYKQKEKETQKRSNEAIPEIFREDNRKAGKPDKKPGAETFLRMYSYIARTKFDKRDSIPSNWKPHSFNSWKQHVEFLRSFVCPYPLPEILIMTAHMPEFTVNDKGEKVSNTGSGLIRLAKKWINEITHGESFYKKNTKFFTKAESHFFLSSELVYEDCDSIIKLYFYAKCRARAINHKLSVMIADVFSIKFLTCFKNKIVESFFDLLARTPDYRYDRGTLGDICDFVLVKIREREKNAFSFSGRTIYSVISLSNEWHECQRREARQAAAMKDKNLIDTSCWKGLGITRFRHETDEFIWTVTELRTAQELVNEGRKMRNCVGGYAHKCASGNSAIFSVERAVKSKQITNNVATVEVNVSTRAVIQAKGSCNTALSSQIMRLITRWGESNRIKVRVLV